MDHLHKSLLPEELAQEFKNDFVHQSQVGYWKIILNLATQEGQMFVDDVMLQLLDLDSNATPNECYTHWFSNIDEAEISNILTAVEAIITTGNQHEVEYWWHHPTLGRIPVRCGGGRTFLDNTYVHMQGYHKNLKSVQQVHTSLRNSIQRIKAMFDAAPFPFSLRDLDFKILECNQAFLDFFNAKTLEDMPKDLSCFYPEKQPCGKLSTEKSKELREAIRKNAYSQLEWMYFDKEGKELPTELTFKQINIGGKNYILSYIRDLREQKAMIAALENQRYDLEKALVAAGEASRSKNLFFANISHEIRTPMNAILGMSYLCLQQECSPQIQHYINNIQTAGKNLLNIINDVLDISKIEAGKLELENTPFSLNAMLDNLSGTLCSLTSTKPVEVLFNVDPSLPDKFMGDSVRLGQVLTNLVSNANKFTEKGFILLHIYAKSQHGNIYTIGVDVTDTGIGMDEKRLDDIFRPFEQEDQTTTRRFGGTGLGLTISKNIVELMGGHISVRSKLGQGTTFSFYVSLLCQEETPWLNTALGKDEKILVLDDTPMACTVLKDMLKLCGFIVHAVENTHEACQLLLQADTQNEPFGLAIIDWNMPDMDGFQSARTILDLKLNKTPALILNSAYGTKLMHEKDQELFSSFIPKPILPIPLWTAVMDALHIKHSTQFAQSEIVEEQNYKVLQGKHVLLAEDNAINQEIAMALLEDLGMHIHIAENGQRAVEIAIKTDLDIVLMDIQMPIMDGLEATKQIRKQGYAKDKLPIIAMTAHAMQMHREQSYDAGMNDHISKPINPNELREKLLYWTM